MIKLLIGIFLTFFPVLLIAAPLEIKNSSGSVKSYDLKKESFKVKSIEIYEPHEQKKLIAHGYSFADVMDKLNPKWREREEVLLTCLDGYQPSIPVDKFLKYDAYFAVAFEGRDKFYILHPEKKFIPVGPFYMVWKAKDNKAINDISSMWAYQVKAVEFIQFSDKFPKMAPPRDSKAQVKNGFLLFREKCMSCHQINGEGGDMGPELNSPVSVVEYFKPKWLRQWILDPTSVRSKAKMPKLFSKHSKDQSKVRDIISYLQAMSAKKTSL